MVDEEEEELLALCLRGALVGAGDELLEDDEEDAVEADVDELLLEDLVSPLALEPFMLESALFVKSELFVLDTASSSVAPSTLSSSYRPGLFPSAIESSRFEGNEGIASAMLTNFTPKKLQTKMDQMAQSLTVPLIVHWICVTLVGWQDFC